MRIGLVMATLILSACVMGGNGVSKDARAKAPPANPMIMGEAISTTALEAAPVAAQTKTAKPVALEHAKPQSAAPAADKAEDAEPKADKAEKPAQAATPAPPPVPQSPAEAKCLKSGGIWAKAGPSGAQACVRRTKDSGKSCTKQTQCEGFCLARSGTCAPITPMFGCNDILQADGRMVTLCID